MAFADAQAGAVIYYGSSPASVTMKEACKTGDTLGFTSGGWYKALATVGSVVQCRAVAAEDAVVGQTITAYFSTTLVGGDRYSGATKGGALYVAESTNDGQITQTAPSTTGDANTVVGYALSEILMAIVPNLNVDSVA